MISEITDEQLNREIENCDIQISEKRNEINDIEKYIMHIVGMKSAYQNILDTMDW